MLLRAFATLLFALSLAGCSSEDTSSSSSSTGGDGGSGEPAWQVVLDKADLDRAVLSIWGSAPDDVFAVGGPLGNSGYEALIVHYDGSTWRELSPGGPETFWWVSGSSATDVWMVGTEGRIVHWDGSAFQEHASGVTTTLWGVFAPAPNDAWIVGGTPGKGTSEENDVVLHWDGSAWTPVVLPGDPLGRSLFKVWGKSAEDFYVVGEAGTIWRRKGGVWTLESDPPIASGTLFTVNGCSATDVYAVGNFDVLHSAGQGFSKLDVALTGTVNGVSCGAPGEVLIVGSGGLKQRLVEGVWLDEFTIEPYSDLHGAWADGAGSLWAVGGDFISKPKPGAPREGVVARYGKGEIAGELVP